jgi:hypothetical protein
VDSGVLAAQADGQRAQCRPGVHAAHVEQQRDGHVDGDSGDRHLRRIAAIGPEADLDARAHFLDLRGAAIADEPVVALHPAQPGAQRRTRQPGVTQHPEVGRVPAAGHLQAEGGIVDQRDGELQDGIGLVDRNAIRGAEHLGKDDPGLPGERHRIESVHLQQAPQDRAHGGQQGVLRFAQGTPSVIQVGA